MVDLAWQTSETAVAYNVYRGDASGGPYSLIGNTSTLRYMDANVSRGSSYFYVVTAVDAAGTESAFSGEISAAVPQ